MRTGEPQFILRIRAVGPESYTVCLSVKYSFTDWLAGRVTLGSDCVDARADLDLHSPHITYVYGRIRVSEDTG